MKNISITIQLIRLFFLVTLTDKFYISNRIL